MHSLLKNAQPFRRAHAVCRYLDSGLVIPYWIYPTPLCIMHYKTWFYTVRSSSAACSLLQGDVPADAVTTSDSQSTEKERSINSAGWLPPRCPLTGERIFSSECSATVISGNIIYERGRPVEGVVTFTETGGGLTASTTFRRDKTNFNPFKPSGAKWLHYKVFKAILV